MSDPYLIGTPSHDCGLWVRQINFVVVDEVNSIGSDVTDIIRQLYIQHNNILE